MRFHSHSYQTLPSTLDGPVFCELTLSNACDNNTVDAAAYIRNCDAPDLAYSVVSEGKGVSIDNTPQIVTVNFVYLDSSPAFTGHYMVNILPSLDSPETRSIFYRADKLSRFGGVGS